MELANGEWRIANGGPFYSLLRHFAIRSSLFRLQRHRRDRNQLDAVVGQRFRPFGDVVDRDRRPSAWSISSAVGTASMATSALAKGRLLAPAMRPARLRGFEPSSTKISPRLAASRSTGANDGSEAVKRPPMAPTMPT